MSSKSSSPQQQAAPMARTGVSEMDYSRFMSQGLNLASGNDLLGLSVRKENLVQGKTTTRGGGIDIFGWHPGETKSTEFFKEDNFKTVGQETLDKMMSMFSMRKKEVDQKQLMPGRAQVYKDILA
jgi:hypothetical protein